MSQPTGSAKRAGLSYRNCETICPISASARARSVIYLVLHLSLSLSLALYIERPRCSSGYTGLHRTYTCLAEEKTRVLSSQKLAYRFINYGMNLHLPRARFFFPFVREPRVGHTYIRFVLDSQRDSLPLAAARKSRLLFLLFSCEHKSLFALRATAFSARRLCTRACTQLGCYRARVSSRVIMFNEGEVTGNVSLSCIRCGRGHVKK